MKNKAIKKRMLNVVLGTIGKTDLIIDLIPTWIKNNANGKIIAFDPRYLIRECFPGKVTHLIDANDKNFTWVDILLTGDICNDSGTLLIINNADLLFPKPKKSIKVRPDIHHRFVELLVKRQEMNIDIIMDFQRPDSVPNRIDYFVTNYTILPIKEDYLIETKSPNHEILSTSIESINLYHEKHGKNPTKEFLNVDLRNNVAYPCSRINKNKFTKIINDVDALKTKVEFV